MHSNRRLAGAAIVLMAVTAACTPTATTAPTGPVTATGAPTAAATATAAASAPASAPATSLPTSTAAAASPGTSPAGVQVAYARFGPRAGSSSSILGGAATLIDAGDGGSTLVVIGVVGGDATMSAAIQEGTCPSPSPLIAYELPDVVTGASLTTVAVSVADLLATDHVINLFVTGSETESSISCGDITELPSTSTP